MYSSGNPTQCSERSEVAQSCLILCDSMHCSLPGFSLHGILQARILEWVAISFSNGSLSGKESQERGARCLCIQTDSLCYAAETNSLKSNDSPVNIDQKACCSHSRLSLVPAKACFLLSYLLDMLLPCPGPTFPSPAHPCALSQIMTSLRDRAVHPFPLLRCPRRWLPTSRSLSQPSSPFPVTPRSCVFLSWPTESSVWQGLGLFYLINSPGPDTQ